LGYFREVFDVQVTVSAVVNECQGGITSALTYVEGSSSVMDCKKKGYSPQVPLFEASAFNSAD